MKVSVVWVLKKNSFKTIFFILKTHKLQKHLFGCWNLDVCIGLPITTFGTSTAQIGKFKFLEQKVSVRYSSKADIYSIRYLLLHLPKIKRANDGTRPPPPALSPLTRFPAAKEPSSTANLKLYLVNSTPIVTFSLSVVHRVYKVFDCLSLRDWVAYLLV